jgi:hypothetical protein
MTKMLFQLVVVEQQQQQQQSFVYQAFSFVGFK